ncbi:ATP-binding cassette domain-containing protein [Lactobacillus corticis]|uniref:ABC transporter ATP-binding protein n=1 Tax=Lactobacillus corticis TaxID=2201249 RepID=A0A916VHD2_9LACO|nr:ATP-binding cassette domain-containing protein [Lactobacillus corticis]GFZ26507.1 ABC transporter ATP-binding protein [Lactobacillus corticis]
MKIVLKNITVKYDDKKVFNGFNGYFSLENLNVIIGKNGVGKTTLLDVLSGLVKPLEGNITGLPPQKKIMYVFQNTPFFADVTVQSLLKMYTSFSTTEPMIKEDPKIKQIYHQNILPLLSSRLGVLSGGERKLVFIYSSILIDKDLYLFDEPLSGVDIENQQKIVYLLEKLSEYRPTIVTSHDVEEFGKVNCIINYLSSKQIGFSGKYDELLALAGNTFDSAFVNLSNAMRNGTFERE